jgi:hypothetical protein
VRYSPPCLQHKSQTYPAKRAKAVGACGVSNRNLSANHERMRSRRRSEVNRSLRNILDFCRFEAADN